MGFIKWLNGVFGSGTKVSAASAQTDQFGAVSKELFYEVLDSESSMILFFTKEDGWIGANRYFFEVFDFADINAFIQAHESIRELFDEESESIFTEFDKSWLDYIRTHRAEGYAVVIVDKTGQRLNFLARCRLIHHHDRELYLLELQNITELVSARRKAEDVEEMKTRFLANIGHEFRTPMNAILGFVELMEKNEHPELHQEHLRMIHTSARNLMSNIEALLDLAQMQNHRLRISESEFNMILEMEELCLPHIYAGTQKELKVTFFIDPKLPSYVTGDLRKIKQIVNNLVHNAIKFTQKGGKVAVDIKLLKRSEDGRCQVGFSVKDTGKGIAKDQIGNITQPFISGEHSDGRLGVGLSLSYGLISMLGGELKIQSEEGRGSVFSFSLPFKHSSNDTLKMVEGKSAKVLLLHESRIEDAHLLASYLRSFGMSVVKANMIDKELYDNTSMLYVVASQKQPEWMQRLAEQPKHCPIVLLLDEGETLMPPLNSTVDMTVEKPLVPSSISAHLVRAFKLPREKTRADSIRDETVSALVVEDNLINQRLIKILLQEYHINVTTASNGEEAVELCGSNDYDIVFMDIDMPVKDGIIATQEIKERERPGRIGYMPIIALTALAMDGDREHLLEEGLDDYLSKPLTREKLEYIISKHLKVKV